MVGSNKNSLLVGLLIIILLIVVSVPFQKRIDNIRGKFRSIKETLYFSSSALKKMSLGYKELLADIYWLRALQYFGGSKFEEQNPGLLYHYFDIITDLDPKFVNAYSYGGTFLAEPYPIGLSDIEKGMRLFDKGRMNNPSNFYLPLEQGFITYLYLKDYDKASELFYEASEKPTLSDTRRASIRGMAASAIFKGGDRELSRQIWKTIYETTTSKGRKKFALRNLKELDRLDMEDSLTDALREYIRRYNEVPSGLVPLKKSGLIKEIPDEPFGGEFIIVNKLNSVKSTTLINEKLAFNQAFLKTKARRFRESYGRFPKDLAELKEYIETQTTDEFPPHPLSQEYVYNPDNGVVKSD